MPPRGKARPDADRQKAFVEGLARSIVAAERAALAGEGRAIRRRLNRHEYENALRDLLGVPWAQVASRLPEDGEAYHFNKSGEALDVSYLQMARFMDSADYAMRLAMATHLERPAKTTRKLYARDERSLRNWWPRENGTLPDRLSFPVLDSHAQPDVRAGRAPATSPETREREAVGKVSSIFSDAGGYSWSGWRAPVAARYKLRIAGYTIWVAGGGVARWFYEGQGAEKAPVYHTLLWHRPNLDEVYPGRRNEPIGVYAQAGGQTRPVGAVDFTPKPTVSEIEVFLLANEVVRTDGSRLFRTRVNGTDEQYVNPARDRGRHAGLRRPVDRGRRPVLRRPGRRGGLSSGCSTGCGWCRRSKRGRACRWRSARAQRPARRRAAAGRGGLGARRRARGALRSRIRGAAGGCRAAVAIVPEEGVSPAGRRGRRAAVPGAVRRSVPEGRRLHAVDALGLHGRPGVAGLRVRRGEAGPARRPRPGHAAGPVPVELDPRRHAAGAGGPRRAEQAGRAARPGRADARRSQGAPLRRGVHRLLARPAEDRRHVAVHHALQRLRARRPAEAGGAGGDAALLRRTPARRPAGAERRRFGLHVPERAAGRALRHRRRLRRPASAR